MDLATVPAAPPTRKNQRTTSWPAPISANVPYQRGSILILSALEWVSVGSSFTESEQVVYQKSRGGDSYIFVKSERFTATPRADRCGTQDVVGKGRHRQHASRVRSSD